MTACCACLIMGPHVHPMARAAQKLQITLTTASVSLGITAVWLVITFVFGRVYCASVCPVGVLSDIFFLVRKRVPKLNKPFKFRHNSRVGLHLLWIYILCLVVGVAAVTFILEPYSMARNMASVFNRDATASTWATISLGSLTGVGVGILSFLAIALSSLRYGREYCSRYCPVGTALGYVQEYSRLHIDIDPDRCTSCGLCEDICRTQSIKVVSRYVDQQRCVRCFDCVAKCPEGAIRYQLNRNTPRSPLLRKVGSK